MCVGIFLVSRFSLGGNFHQAFPETLAAKQAALRRSRAVQIQQGPRIRSGAFKYRIYALGSGKWPRGLGAGKLRERGSEFLLARVKSSPGISVKMINDRPGMKELADARHILARDAEDHVEEFVEAKHLPHERPHGNVSGFFLGVANGNRFRQWHDARIRGGRLKSRYEIGVVSQKTGLAAV